MRRELAVIAALVGAGCDGNDSLCHHRLTLVSMSSGAAAYKQAVGTITMVVEVRDPDHSKALISEEIRDASLERGVTDHTLYADGECHGENKLTWSLVSVDGMMKTPSGVPRPRPSWDLEKRGTVVKSRPRTDESHGGLRRTTSYGIDMRNNDVQLVVAAITTKCDAEGTLLVLDDQPPEERPPDAGPPEEMRPDASAQ